MQPPNRKTRWRAHGALTFWALHEFEDPPKMLRLVIVCRKRSRKDEEFYEGSGEYVDEKELLKRYADDPEQARNIIAYSMAPGNEKSRKFHAARNRQLYLDMQFKVGHRKSESVEENKKRQAVTPPGQQYGACAFCDLCKISVARGGGESLSILFGVSHLCFVV